MNGYPVGVKVDGNYLRTPAGETILAANFLEVDEMFSFYSLSRYAKEKCGIVITNNFEQVPVGQIQGPVTPFRQGLKIQV